MSLLKILPPSSPEFGGVQRSLQYLKPRLEAAQKRETAEMMDKLKGLGNSILGAPDRLSHGRHQLLTFLAWCSQGNFGLSTDNFKFEPTGQGGYSMKFEQNP